MIAIPHNLTCSCGEVADHVVMRRRTFDGVDVCLWSDGCVTGSLGRGLSGVPMRRPRTVAALSRALAAGRLMLGEVCIREAGELGALYAACERAARLDAMPGTVRRILRESKQRAPSISPNWTVVSADRDGTATERVCRLPRLRWPGLVVVDYCGGPGSRDGRYVLCDVKRSRHPVSGVDAEYLVSTGFAFRNLPALWAHLETLK